MPIQTSLLTSIPGVIAVYTGDISADDVEHMYEQSQQLLGDKTVKCYRINYIRQANANFNDFVDIARVVRRPGKFRTADTHIEDIFVGITEWSYNLRNVLRYMGIQLPAFQSIDDAMSYVWLDISGHFDAPDITTQDCVMEINS